MNKLIYSLIFGALIIFLLGCSQQAVNTEQNSTKEASNEEVIKDEKENEVENKNKENKIYIHSKYKYIINLDERLSNNVLFEESGDKLFIYYNDSTLIKDKVLIGYIEALTKNEWDNLQKEDGFYLANYTQVDNNLVFVFTPEYMNPYLEYQTFNLETDDSGNEIEEIIYPKEELEYEKDSVLFEKSLLSSEFILGSILLTQNLPQELDSNQQVGVELSINYYNDMKKWYDSLSSTIQSGDLDEFKNTYSSVISERTEKYPELRQIPFPSFELGNNIASCLDMFYWMQESSYSEKETKKISLENQLTYFEQNLEVIKEQIKEAKKKQEQS